jgi:hypothetical protein
MLIISIDPDHVAASAARRMVGERTPPVPLRESPPRVAKTKAKSLIHGTLAAAAAHPAADFDCADYAAARGSIASPALSINSSSSSASDDSEMTRGNCATLGHKSTGLTDSTDYLPASPAFSEEDIFAGDGGGVDNDMPTDAEASKYFFLIVLSITWSKHLLASQTARL